MSRKNPIRKGGGDKTVTPTQKLANQKKVFKPLIASSLALALGISVASATDPQIQWNNAGAQTEVNLTGSTWEPASSNSQYKQLQVGGSAVENIIMTFVPNTTTNTSSNAPVVTPSGSIHTRVDGQDTTISGYLIQQGGQANGGKPELTLTTGSSASAGIMLGANGTGNLYLNFLELTPDDTDGNDGNWGDPSKTQIRKMILNLSNATNTQYSLVGNIIVDAGRAHKVYGENAFEATFGKGMKGDLTLRANVLNTDYRNDLISKIIFLGGSGIDGNVVINAGQSPSTVNSIGGTKVPYGGNNLVFRQNGSGSIGEISGTLTVSGGYTRLYHEATNVAFSTAMVLRGGTLVFDNYKNIETALADDTLNNSNIASNTLTLLNLDQSEISGGSITFNEYNQIIFGSDGSGTFTIAPKTIGTPTSEDPDATTTYSGGTASFVFGSTVSSNDPDNPIIKGNINVTKGNVIFALSDTSSVNGSNPFTTPDATQPQKTYYVDGSISITDGGISAFWDDSKGFYGKVATTNGNSFSISGGLIGKNDIWFANAQNISSIQATSGVSHLVFDQAATIGTLPSNGDPLNDVIVARGGNAMILFKGQATINGNLKSSPNRNTTIIAKQGITFNGSISALAGQGTTYNRFDLSGETVFQNSAISAISDTVVGGGFKKYNILKFTGNVSGTITDLTSFVSLEEMQNGFSSRANNVLSFESNEAQSLSITTINGQIPNGKQNGFNYIGKGLTDGEQDSLTLNSSIFSDGTWRNDSHTANLSLTTDVIQTVKRYSSSSYGSNYINVKDLTNTGSITTNGGGDNNISIYGRAELTRIAVNVGSGNNRIYTYGTTSIGGDIIMESKNRNDSNSTNFLILTGTSVALGKNDSKIRVKINNVANSGGAGTSGQNTILLGGDTTNTVNISELSVVGDWGGNPSPIPRTFNMLSFNNTTSNNGGSIDSISSRYGSNIIGKDLIDQNGTYNTALFGSGNPTIQSGFIAEFVKDNYSANGSFVIGDNSGPDITDAITTSREGTNYINIKGSTTIKGNILSSNREANGKGHNNLIVLTGTSATLGENGKEISIRIDNSSVCGWKYSNNTLLFGATTNRLYLSMIGVSGDYGDSLVNPRTFNALSFNSSNNVVQGNATVSAVFGNNIIAKNLITQDGGYNSDLFRSVDNVYTMQDAFATVFMVDTYQASGTFALGDITNSDGGGNYINVETLTVAGNMSSSGAGNYIKANNFSISGNITSSTNNTISTVTWTNTESGAVIATGSGTNSITATNGTATFAGIITKDYNASSSGNTINLGTGSITINTRSGDSDSGINGKALYAKNGNNSNTITAGTILVNGEIYANSEATNSLTASSSIAVTGNIGGGATNNLALSANSATLTLNGKTTGGTSHDITNLTAVQSGNNTLTLDNSTATDGAMATTIRTITNGENLTINFKGSDVNRKAELNLSQSSITLKSVAVADQSTNNIFNLANNQVVSFSDRVSIRTGGIDFNLNNSQLDFNNGFNNASTVNFNLAGANNTIAGIFSNTSTLNFNVNANTALLIDSSAFSSGTNNINFSNSSGTTLALNNGQDSLETTGGSTNLNFNENGVLNSAISTTSGNLNITIADGKSATLNKNVTLSNGINKIIFADGSNASTLSLKGAENTFTALELTGNSSNNTIKLGEEQSSRANFSQALNINASQTLSFDLANSSTLLFTQGVTNAGTLNLNFTSGSSVFDGALNNTGTTNITIGTNGISYSDSVSASFTQGISGNGTLALTFNGDFDNPYHNASFVLGNGNTSSTYNLTSITSQSNSAILALNGEVTANVTDAISIAQNKTLVFGFSGNGDSTVNANAGITVASGGTLGIAIGGSGNKNITTQGNSITLGNGTTLRVDFLEGSSATATLGNGSGFTIGANQKSIINFYGNSTATLAGGITLDGGDNTVNFLGNATLGKITLTSGNNTINVYEGITGTISNVGEVGNVANTINLASNAVLDLSGKELNTANFNNTLNFNGDNSTLLGGFGKASGATGIATINVGDASQSSQAISALISGNVSDANIAFKATNSTLTLQGSNNTLSIDSGSNVAGSIILANTANINATITNAITSANNISLAFAQGNENKTFTLSEGNNTLFSIILDHASSNNTLSFIKGSNTISTAFALENNQGLSIALGNSSTDSSSTNSSTISLNLAGMSGGNSALKVIGNNTADASLSGGEVSVASLNMSATNSAALTLSNSLLKTQTIDISSADSTITLDGNSSTSGTTLDVTSAFDASSLSIVLKAKGADKGATLTLHNQGFNKKARSASLAQTTIKSLTLDASATTNNTLNLLSGALSITNGITIGGSSQVLNINLLGYGTTLDSAITTSASSATTLINVGNATSSSSAIITKAITTGTGANTNVVLNSNSTLTLQGNNNTLSSVSGTGTLVIDTALNAAQTTINSNVTNLSALLSGQTSKQAELVLGGANNTLNTLRIKDGSTNNTLTLKSGNTSITQDINIQKDQGLSIALNGSSLSVNHIAVAGELNFNLSGNNTLNTQINNSGVTTFNASTSGAVLKLTDSLIFNSGSNAINLDASNASLAIQNAQGASSEIQAIGGNTSINFNNTNTTLTASSIFAGNNATATINVKDSASGIIDGNLAIATNNAGRYTGRINAVLNNGSSLTLQGNNNILSNVSGNGTLILSGAQTQVLSGVDAIAISLDKSANLALLGSKNTLSSLSLASNAVSTSLSLNGGNTTINSAVSVGASKILSFNMADSATLALTGGVTNAGTLNLNFTSGNSVFDGAITNNGVVGIKIGSNAIEQTSSVTSNFTQSISGSGTLALSFEGEFNNPYHNASFVLGNGSTSTTYNLTSIASDSNNAILTLNGAVTADVADAINIAEGKTLVFGFSGNGNSTITANTGITVASGGTLGIAIGGSGEKKVNPNAQITLGAGTTLRVDFLEGSSATATLGNNNGFTIDNGKSSIINFYGNSTATLKGGITLAGGDNTVNFLGNATLEKITLNSGNNTINVYEGITGTMNARDVGNVTNIINLASNAVLDLSGGSLTSSSLANTLNFNGDGSILKGGFGKSDGAVGSASINVGNQSTQAISALISGNVSNASIAFINNATLRLQGDANTISALSGKGKLILDKGTAKILGVVNSSNQVALEFGAGGSESESKTFEFAQGNTTLSGVNFADGNNTHNKLIFNQGENTIYGAIALEDNQDLTLTLGNASSPASAVSLALNSGANGNVDVVINSSQSTLSGGNINLRSLKLAQENTTLRVQSNLLALNTLEAQTNTTLILDALSSSHSVKASIQDASKAQELALVFADGSESKTLLLQQTQKARSINTLKSISLQGASTNNTLALDGGSTNIAQDITIQQTQSLNIALNQATLSVGNIAVAGKLNFDLTGSNTLNAQLNNTGTTSFTLNSSGDASLKLSDSQVFSSGNSIINLNASDASLSITNAQATLSTITLSKGNNEINFKGKNTTLNNAITNNGATTSINVGTSTSSASGVLANNINNQAGTLNVALNSNSTLTLKGSDNTLSKVSGKGALILDASSATISQVQSSVELRGRDDNQASLTLASNSNIQTLKVSKQALLASTAGSSIQTSEMSLDQGSTLTLREANLNLASLNTLGSDAKILLSNSSTLNVSKNLQGENLGVVFTDGKENAFSTLSLNANSNYLSNLSMDQEASYGVLSLGEGSTSTINAISPLLNSQTLLLDFRGESTLSITNSLAALGGNVDVNFSAAGGNVLYLQGESNVLNDINGSGHISLSNTLNVNRASDNANRNTNRMLTITGAIKGDLDFSLYSSPSSSWSDKVIISSAQDTQQTHTAHLIFAPSTTIDAINQVVNNGGDIALVTYNASNDNIAVDVGNTTLGFDQVLVQTNTQSTDIDGNLSSTGGYNTLFISGAKSLGVIQAQEQVVASALTLNYDLYLANFNSLNKRMGELRENAHSQGVWARVFNGAQTNKMREESKSNYTTIQAGYDYAFGGEGFNNYLGVALSYALSTTSNNQAVDTMGNSREIKDIYSNAFEIGIYNSFVSDMGWYNDTIAKFSYLLSDFNISDSAISSSTQSTKNFGLTLSNEVGYLFAIGEEKEWRITPQLELSAGYINQSNLKQTLGSIYYLDAIADSVFMVRGRVGASFGYDFKKFTSGKDINASVYVGSFYEIDYFSGGDISFSTNSQSTQYSNHLESDDRFVLNVGTNMTIKDNTRIYFDFEKSFNGKITTDYQVNVGVRYSFGESNGYTPAVEKAEFKAPLKVEDNQEETTKENKEENNEEGKEETKEN